MMDNNFAAFYYRLVDSAAPKSGSMVVYPSWEKSPAFISESLARMFGYAAEEMYSLLRESYVSCIHPEDYEIIVKNINVRFESRIRDIELYFRGLKRNGNILWLMANCSLARDHEGNDVYVICLTDITEQKNTEETLRLLSEEYRLAIINNRLTSMRYDIKKREISPLCRDKLPFSDKTFLCNMPESAIEEGLISDESLDDYLAFFNDIHSGKPNGKVTFRHGRNNAFMYCRASYSTIFDRHNNPAYAIISIENVTSLRKIELAYERWRQSLSAIPKSGYLLVEQNITNGAYENIEGNLLARFPDTEGLPVQNFIGYMTKRSISGANGPSDWQLRGGYLLEAFNKGKRSFDTEFQMLDINGHPVWLSLNVQTVGHSDRDEVKAFFLCRDIDREKRHEIALMTKAEIDELTGIYNRRTFISKVEDIIDASRGEKHAIIIMDLDNFKSVNDTYGHDVGDRVLSEASELLRSFLRSSDILGRIGGDEFMVCMRNVTDVQLLNKRAQIMCHMFEKQWKDNFNVTVSAGIALFPAEGNNFEDLYKHADIAMYAAKQRGRNQFAFYSSSLPNDAMCPATIESGENTSVFSKPEYEKVSNILKVNDMLIKQQEAYERYKMAFEHTNTVMFECNLFNSSFFAPRQMKEYALGISDIALMLSGDMPSDAVHRHDCDAVIRFMLQKLSGNSGRKDITVRLKKADGSYNWCNFGVIVTKNKDGLPVRIMGLITPVHITEDMAAIQLNALLNNIYSGIMLIEMSEDPIPFYVSDKFYDAESENIELCRNGKVRLIDLICPEDRDELLQKAWHAARTGESVECTLRHFKDGKIAWKHVNAVRIPHCDREAPVLMLELHDITKQKEAELDNLKLAKQLSMALEMTGVITYEVDIKNRLLFFNEAAASKYSLQEELTDIPDSLFRDGRVHPRSADTMRRFCNKMFSGVEHGVCIVRCKGTRSSEYIKVRASYRLIYDDTGKPSKAVGILEDLG